MATTATKEEREDAARWAAVEEATELLHEERFREAMVELRGVLEDDPKNSYAYYFLFRIARAIQEKSRELAIVESMDGGKPIKESRDVDLPLAAAHFF